MVHLFYKVKSVAYYRRTVKKVPFVLKIRIYREGEPLFVLKGGVRSTKTFCSFVKNLTGHH